MIPTQEELMTKRILLAGILGGIANVCVASLAHMMLPLGQTGIKEISERRLCAERDARQPGRKVWYVHVSGNGVGRQSYPRAKRRPRCNTTGRSLAANPSGLLIYHPPGAKALTPGQLATEFVYRTPRGPHLWSFCWRKRG